jgi:hypothetical protein
MPPFQYDAFISYPSVDRVKIQPLVQALQDAKLRVYWDQMLLPGEVWPVMLERGIATSRYTLVCVTSGALASRFVEAEMKRSDGKLIPIWLEDAELPILWEAYVGRIQRANLIGCRFLPSEPAFAQLCAVVGGTITDPTRPGEETLEARARRLIQGSSVADLSLVIALALLGGAATSDVTQLAADFERRFREHVAQPPSGTGLLLEAVSARLQRVGGEITVRADQRFGIKIECARFIDPAIGHTVLALAWSDYEILRGAIAGWIKDWAGDSPSWIRWRLALNLGVLAQDERRFDAIWREIMRPILFDNARRRGKAARERFEVADLALSIAARDPLRQLTVAAILGEMMAEPVGANGPFASKPAAQAAGGTSATGGSAEASGQAAAPKPDAALNGPGAAAGGSAGASAQPNTDSGDAHDDLAAGGSELARIYLVARLSFGYTGNYFPDLAVKALRRLAERGSFESLKDILGQSFHESMSSARGVGDGILWNPIHILDGILQWAADVPSSERPLPLSIFILGLADLPLASDGSGHLSLTSIMQSKRGIDTLRRGFLLGLALPETREIFEDHLRHWRDEQHRNPVEPDPLLALVCALIRAAPTENDRARVRYLFRDHYDDAKIDALALSNPELSGSTVVPP